MQARLDRGTRWVRSLENPNQCRLIGSSRQEVRGSLRCSGEAKDAPGSRLRRVLGQRPPEHHRAVQHDGGRQARKIGSECWRMTEDICSASLCVAIAVREFQVSTAVECSSGVATLSELVESARRFTVATDRTRLLESTAKRNAGSDLRLNNVNFTLKSAPLTVHTILMAGQSS